MTHNYGNGLAGKALVQIVGQTLRSGTHGIDVHTVAASTHNTTQTSRTKFQILVEAFYQLRLIIVLKHFLHFSLSLGIESRSQPFLSFLGNDFNQFLIFHKLYYFIG